jgi:Domain of unknown function (DUF4431)
MRGEFYGMTRRVAVAALLISAVGLIACSAQNPICQNLSLVDGSPTFEGVLSERLFAGPPNFESIAGGDAEIKALILELDEDHRAYDVDGFIECSSKFDLVQLTSDDDQTRNLLRSAVGRRITVNGEGMGAHTGWHQAPVVFTVKDLAVLPAN